jgi:hypothetical protein
MWLWDRDPRGDVKWLDPEEVELYDFEAAKRRFFFEAERGADLLSLLPQDRRRFYEILNQSSEAGETAKADILEALAFFYGDPKSDEAGEHLQIWTSLRYEALAPPTAFVSSLAVPKDHVSLRVPRLRPQVAEMLEYTPDHVRLVVSGAGGGIGLDLDLDLWLALMSIRRGMPQKYHDPVVGRRLDDFMSRVAAQRRDGVKGYVQVHVRDVDASTTRRIDVSVETKKYRL